MGYWIGVAFGALVATLLLSRLTLWMLKKLDDNERRILIAHALVLAFAVIVGGLGLANGGPPRFLFAASTYGPAVLLWLILDLLGLKGRRAKAAPQS